MKKLIMLMVAAFAAMVPSMAETWTDTDTGYTWTYLIDGDGTVTLALYDEYDNSIGVPITPLPVAEVVIPNEIDGKSVTGLSTDYILYFAADCGVTSIVLPVGVTNIVAGSLAGGDPSSLTNITVAASNPVYKSVNGIVYSKDGDELVLCPYGVTGTVQIPSGVKRIADRAFHECRYLECVEFPAMLEEIGEYAFYDCSSLASVSLPESVKTIGCNAFHLCGSLATVSLNEGLEVIPSYAFRCCAINSISIPSTISSIGNDAFAECSSLGTVIFVGSENDIDIAPSAFIATPYDAGKSFGLVVNEYGTLVGFHGTAPENVVISNDLEGVDLTGIGYAALSARNYNTSSMTNVVVLEGVTWIGDYAFADDETLESVTLPESLQSISYNAFYGCTALRELRIPSGVESVSDTLFEGCTNLTVYAPETLSGMFSVPEEDGCRIVDYAVPQYTVMFNANGGTVEGEATVVWTVYEGRALGQKGYDELGAWVLPTPTFNGHDFLGWFTAVEGGTQVTAETVVTGAMTLYAHWVKICDVTFDANGGMVECYDEWGNYSHDATETSWTVPKGTAIGNLPYVWYEDDAHFFTGWFDLNGNEFTEDTIVTNNMTVTARWIDDDGSFKMLVSRSTVIGYFGTCPAVLTATDWPEGMTSIGNDAFNGASQLESVSIPAGITNIGCQAFASCYSLTNAAIPASTEAIGDYAFSWSSLATVTFVGGKENIADLSEYAFWDTPYDRSLQFSMIVDENGIVVGYHGTCPAVLTATDWPEEVTTIGNDAFNGASQLESVSIPAGVTNIGYQAFAYCYSLTNATIPASVEAIDDYAFRWCSGLSSVTFTDAFSRPDIADSAFDGTPWAQENMPTVLIRFDEHGDETEDGTTLGGYHGASPVTLDIPVDVTAIGAWAFNSCNTLQELTVPTNVTEIGDCAFASCHNLAHVFLPKALEGVIDASSVFYDSPVTVYYYEGTEPTFATVTLDPGEGTVDMVTFRVIPGNAIGMLPTPTLNGYSFLGWFTAAAGGSQVTAETVVTGAMTLYAHWEEITYIYNYIDNGDGTVTLSRFTEEGWWVDEPISPMPVGAFTVPDEIDGKRVVAIGDNVFEGYEMTSVVIPAGVTNISWAAFSTAFGLTNITVAAGNPAYKDIGGVLYTKDGKTLMVWPRAKGGDAVVASGTECIGDEAFYSNDNLTSVSLPTGLKSIGNNAFAFCQNESFVSVTIPASVETIGAKAFGQCSHLSTVHFLGTEGDIDIAATAFIGTPYDATRPFALIVDDYGRLVGIHGVAPTNVVISDYLEGVDLTGIDHVALSAWNYNTSSMTNVVVPEGVTWIGDYAFAADEALESVTLPESLQSISYNAFQLCTALRELRIPSGVRSVHDTLFEGCTNLTIHAPETLRGAFDVPDGCTIEYYEVPQYTVTFDANGGTVNGGATTNCLIYAGQTLGVEGYDEWGYWGRWLPTPTYDGHDFLGWFTAAEGGTQVTAETVVTSNMTLYAHWESVTPPDNDNFADAAMIGGASGGVAGTNLNASIEEGEPLSLVFGDGSTATVWWRWTAPTNGTCAFSTLGSDFDTVLGVYTGSAVDELEELAKNDDSGDRTSAVTFNAVMGTTYYIAVGGYGSNMGSIVLSWGVDVVIVDAGGGKTVSVPGSWLEEYDTLWNNYGGNKADYAISPAGNGRKVWECYVLGLNPKMDDDFTIVSFPMNADGTPDLENIEYYPPQEDWNVPAQPVVKGAAALGDEWQTVTDQNKSSLRFFKVEVELP